MNVYFILILPASSMDFKLFGRALYSVEQSSLIGSLIDAWSGR